VIVHPDETRNHGAATQIHHARSRRHRDAATFSDFANRAVFNHNGLITNGRRSRAINHAYMLQDHHWRVHADKALRNRRKRNLFLGAYHYVAEAQQNHGKKQFAHALPLEYGERDHPPPLPGTNLYHL